MLAWCVALLAVPARAQSPGRPLHREIPGDLGFGELPAGVLSPPGSAAQLASAAGGAARWDESVRPGERLLRPRETWGSAAREMDRDTRSPPGTELRYEEVFNPSVAPFKRTHAYDAVDDLGRLVVRDPSLRPLPVDVPPSWGNAPAARFTGDVFVELSPNAPTPIPSVAGEQRVVSYRTVPETPLAFFEDSAGNLFVRAPLADLRRVRLGYVLEAPQRAFAVGRVPNVPLSTSAAHEGLPAPEVPEFLRAAAPEVLNRVGVLREERMPAALRLLAGYFREFRDGDLRASLDGGVYRALALGHVGACRHRAYAFVLTLHALGMNARFVGNEAHAWAEVAIPGEGWARVDLGGWNVPLRTDEASARETFVPEVADTLPRPPGYGSLYSATPNAPTRHTRVGHGEPGATDPDDDADDAGVNPGATANPGTGAGTGTGNGTMAASGTAAGVEGAPGAAPGAAPLGSGLREDPAHGDPANVRSLPSLRIETVRPVDTSTGPSFVRGTLVEVGGSAFDEGGAAAVDLPVSLELWRGGRPVRADRTAEASPSLGAVVTGDDGRFRARVLLPMDLASGEYDLRAVTPGDARRLPARSE